MTDNTAFSKSGNNMPELEPASDLNDHESQPRSNHLLESLKRFDEINLAAFSSNINEYARQFHIAAETLQQISEPVDVPQWYLYLLFIVRLGPSFDSWAVEFMQEASLTSADCASGINFDTIIEGAKAEQRQRSQGESAYRHHPRTGRRPYQGQYQKCRYCRQKGYSCNHSINVCWRLNPHLRRRRYSYRGNW